MSDLLNAMQQEHEKYLKIDEDEILNKLTAEELEQLTLDLDELDPDVRMIIAMSCEDYLLI